MKIMSWNVNGIRAVEKKGFHDWFAYEDPDVLCIQEAKAFKHQVSDDLKQPAGYYAIWHEGERPGYAGTVIYTKKEPISVRSSFEEFPHFHADGRVTEVKFPEYTLLNIYFPNGNPRSNGEAMLPYKLNFYEDFMKYMNQLRERGERIIACGDYNVCHKAIDIARPEANKNSIGFLEVERQKLDKLIDQHNYIDVFRHFHPEKTDSYTWWSYRAGARPRNVGWRIDYFFVSPDMINDIKSVHHHTDVMGSDHCPLSIELF